MAKNLRWTVIHNKVNGLWWNKSEWSSVAQVFTTRAVAERAITKFNLVPNEVELMDWAIYDAEWQGYWAGQEREKAIQASIDEGSAEVDLPYIKAGGGVSQE